MSTTSQRTTRDGLSQLVRRWAAGGEPWAAMLIVHGLGEHSGRYEHSAVRFAAAGIEVTAFDLRGHGETDGDRAYVESWQFFLDDVEDLLGEQQAKGSPMVLLGHSMGALIALSYAVSERPQPDALVLSASALAGGKAWQRALAGPLARLAPRLALPTAIKGEQLSRDPKVGEAYFADPMVQTKATTKLGAEVFTAMERTAARLSRLRIPALAIHGGVDTLVPPQASLPLAELSGVERRLYPRLRHEAFNEPEGPEVIDEVTDWLRRTLGG